jgi:2-aminobenzoylacetyl-CoA thioesterase
MVLIQNPPVQILDRLWMLGTAGYPLYLVRGRQQDTIFEGGIGPLAAVLRQQLNDLDIAADRVRQLIVTHAHPDHVMAVPALRELCPGIQVVASPTAAQTLAVEKVVAFFAKMDDALTGSLIDQGLASEEQRRPPLAENRIGVDREITEGDTVEVDDGVEFQVLQTPGHSDCSLSFYEPQARVLIISDATGYYLPQLPGWWPNYFSDYGAYVQSIERLATIDADVLCLSHNGAIRGADEVATYFRDALAATKAYHQCIVAAANSGKSVRDIAEVLGQEIHDKAPLMPLEFFQKNCGILVKASLRHEGMDVAKA